MKKLTDEQNLQLADLYFANKAAIEQLEAENKAILQELSKQLGDEDGYVGNHKLTKVLRVGRVKYAEIVKVKLPGLDLEPYRGAPSEYLQLK